VTFSVAQAARAELARRERDAEITAECEQSLMSFTEHAWRHFESNAFERSWHGEAVCEHLEAVALGEISNLIINIPPRSAKTNLVIVCYPCWTWARPYQPEFPRMGPQVRFLCAAYGVKKAEQDGVTARRLLKSTWYQRHWGKRVKISADRDSAGQFDNEAGGSRINTGIPESLGKGGMIRILDDPNKSDEAEGGPVLESVLRAYDEVWSTRSNDPVNGAQILIMQRLAENDLTGHILAKNGRNVTHLYIPAEYEASRHCITVLGMPGHRYEWHDPRGLDDAGDLIPMPDREKRNGTPFWPERNRVRQDRQGNPINDLDEQAREWGLQKALEIGSHAWSAQFQQIPVARGGNVIDARWWRLWEGDYPKLGTVVASYDGASGEKQVNDYSACTVWGAFAGPRGRPCLLLLDAWRVRAPLYDVVQRLIATCQDARPGRRAEILDSERDDVGPEWHPATNEAIRFVRSPGEKKLTGPMPRWQVDYLLVENKGPGMPVASEILRLMGSRRWNTVLVDPEGSDKYARLVRTQHLFQTGVIFAPDTDWAQMVIDETSSFPKSKHDDLTDTVSQAVNWLRKVGVALTKEEYQAEELEELTFRREPEPLYDV